MNFGSVCSGIEAASVAWNPLGWHAEWFAEIDPFCSSLLKQKYPGVTNHGDISKIKASSFVDLVVGGTPCQSFSVQGQRAGMDDPRGQLVQQFIRLVRDIGPRWFIWENVPGVVSIDGGVAFKDFIHAFVQLGYCVAWRVLDLQYFGRPQRRRRVIAVGHLGDWRAPGAVLFEHASNAPDNGAFETVQERRSRRAVSTDEKLIYGWTGDETPKFGISCIPTLRASQGGEGVGILTAGKMRKLTIVEWERLQGFPDNYTRIEYCGKQASDSVRRTAIGNAFPVPIFEWLGKRIQLWSEHGSVSRI